MLLCVFFFFFKQKTAYEMVSDWSSDVCSSDLPELGIGMVGGLRKERAGDFHSGSGGSGLESIVIQELRCRSTARSEERRVGKECRSRWATYHEKKKQEKMTDEHDER